MTTEEKKQAWIQFATGAMSSVPLDREVADLAIEAAHIADHLLAEYEGRDQDLWFEPSKNKIFEKVSSEVAS